MLVPRIVAAGLLIAVGLVVVGGGAGVAAIKIWSYPVELVPKPSTATSFLSTTAAKKKNDASFVVDHALPKIIRKRMATEGVMTKDVCEADFYFVPHGIATLMRKAYRHSYKRTGQKKMVMEGGINRLLKDLAALSLDKGERHIFNVEEATAKYTINQQNSYRTRYSILRNIIFLHTLNSPNPQIKKQDIQLPPFCHDCPSKFPTLPLDAEQNMLWTTRERIIAYFGFIEEGFWNKFKFDLVDVCNSSEARTGGAKSKGECAVLHKPSRGVTAYELYSNATFCLCPPSLEYVNNHMPSAVAAGCLPIIYPANDINLPWKDVVPYGSFSEIIEEEVDLKKPLPDRAKEVKEIGKLHEISDSLLKMPLDVVAARRSSMRQHRMRFLWQENGTDTTGAPQKPDAFDTLIEVLEKRVQDESQEQRMKRLTACREMLDSPKWKDNPGHLLYYND